MAEEQTDRGVTRQQLERQFFEMLMDSQWWSAEQLLAYQRSQLAQLLHHARTNVPFYRDRLDCVMGPSGDIDWDRWSEIPIVKRADLAERRVEMQAPELPQGHGPAGETSTSGSTSQPITVSINALMTLANNACRWRGQVWNKIDWHRNLAIRLGNTTAPLVPPYAEPRGQWGPHWKEGRGRVWEINVKLPVPEALEFFRTNDIAYFNTGAAPAHVFALEAERLGLAAPRLHLILSQGASVGTADREACRRVFGAEFVETYSAKEGGQMAHPCEVGRLHINMETCLVEVVDQQGKPVRPGESGRVIVTPLFNTAQPLIRYEQGDIARAGSPCSCGRYLPTLAAIEGRNSLFFTHPDGRKATSLLPDYGRVLLDCTFWQIAQTGPLDFEVRYVPNEWERMGDEAALIRLFRDQYFDDAQVTLKRVRSIPLSASGKYIEYKVEMERAS